MNRIQSGLDNDFNQIKNLDNKKKEYQTTINTLEAKLQIARDLEDTFHQDAEHLKNLESELQPLEQSQSKGKGGSSKKDALYEKYKATSKNEETIEDAQEFKEKGRKSLESISSTLGNVEKDVNSLRSEFDAVLSRFTATEKELELKRRKLSDLKEEGKKLERDSIEVGELTKTVDALYINVISKKKDLEEAIDECNRLMPDYLSLKKVEIKQKARLETFKEVHKNLFRILNGLYEASAEGLVEKKQELKQALDKEIIRLEKDLNIKVNPTELPAYARNILGGTVQNSPKVSEESLTLGGRTVVQILRELEEEARGGKNSEPFGETMKDAQKNVRIKLRDYDTLREKLIKEYEKKVRLLKSIKEKFGPILTMEGGRGGGQESCKVVVAELPTPSSDLPGLEEFAKSLAYAFERAIGKLQKEVEVLEETYKTIDAEREQISKKYSTMVRTTFDLEAEKAALELRLNSKGSGFENPPKIR